MARMYPERFPSRWADDPKRGAERRVFDAVQSQLPRDWTAFYSVAWVGRYAGEDGGLTDGEADFVLVHPERGLVVLEVKGGEISYDPVEGQWYTTDGAGETHALKRDPFDQAMRSKKQLLRKVESLPGWTWREVRDVPAAHAVVFPGTVRENIRGGLPAHAAEQRALIIDASDFAALHARLEEVARAWRGERDPWPSRSQGQPFVEALTSVIAPTTHLAAAPLGVVARQQAEAMDALTAQQVQVFRRLRALRRLAVPGVAGSGKTVIAVERARQLAREGFRPLLTCFSPRLAARLIGQTRDVAESEDGKTPGLRATTFHGWCRHAAEQAGVPLPVLADGGPDWNAYPDALMDALALRPDLRRDAVLVDEGQDFAPHWWAAVRESLTPDGVFYVFYDDNQNLAGDAAATASLPEELGLETVPLDENLRNTRAIFDALAPYYRRIGPDPVSPRGPEGRRPEREITATGSDEGTALRAALERALRRLLVTERLRSDEVVVLTARDPEESGVPGALGALPPPLRDVPWATAEEFKGLEAPVVVFAEIDAPLLDRGDACQQCYVALSRARSHAVLVGDTDAVEAVLSGRAA